MTSTKSCPFGPAVSERSLRSSKETAGSEPSVRVLKRKLHVILHKHPGAGEESDLALDTSSYVLISID